MPVRPSVAVLLLGVATPALAQTPPADTASGAAVNAQGIAGDSASPATGAPVPTTQSEPAASDQGIADIIVTAERREVSVQKTPLNISVIGGETLTKQGIVGSRELLDAIPGLKMNVANPNAYIGLYGLASGGGTQYSDAVMAFNYGGVPLSRQTSASSAFYDLERVEVLKGPQGTLYGRNATVGSINLLPARPRGDFAASGTVTLGNYNTVNTTGYINVPASDTVWTRVAFQTSRHDGYFTNGLDDADNYGARASVLVKPDENLSVLLWADGFWNRAKGPYSTWRYYLSATQEYIDPDNPWFGLGLPGTCSNQLLCPSFAATSAGGVNAVANPGGFTNTGPTGYGSVPVYGQDGRNNADQIILAAEINYRTPIGQLTIIPAHVYTKINFLTYSNGLRFSNLTHAKQDSLEARLTSDGGGPLRWVVGGFLYHEHQDAFLNNLQSSGYAILRTPNYVDRNAAAFADATFSITDALRINGGIRYTHQKKTQDGYTTASGLTAANLVTITAAGGACTTVASPQTPVLFQDIYYFPTNFCVVANGGRYVDDNVSWKAGVEADLAPDVMLYGSVRTGFRAGGFTVGTQNSYRPEKLLAYELGFKSRFLDRRVQLNVAGFYWDYTDQQVSQLQLYYLNGIAIGQTSYPSNFDGNLYGVEADLQVAATRDDRIAFDVLWSRGKYDSTPPVATVNSAALVPQFNLPRNNLPRFVISASYDHSFRLGGGGSIVAGGRVHYESGAVLRIIDPALLTPGDIRKAYAKADAQLTYNDADDRFSVTAFVNNITDKAVVGVGASGQTALGTFYRPSSNPTGARSATLDPPRTYGVRGTVRF